MKTKLLLRKTVIEKSLLIVFLLCLLGLPSTAAPVCPPCLRTAEFSVTLTRGGGLIVERGAASYTVESVFSYPQMTTGKWNALRATSEAESVGEWKVLSSAKTDALEVTARGQWYELARRVTLHGDRVLIRDTFTNISNDDVAIGFDNRVTSKQPPREINISGKYVKSHFPYNARVPTSNPTIFIAVADGGMGLVALDDFYRLQYALKHEGQAAWFENRSFGLPPRDSYTFEWALYPTASPDYYEFINLVRRDYVKPVTIEGGCAFLPYSLVLKWPRDKMAAWLRHRSVAIVILVGPSSGAPWLGGYGHKFYKLPGSYDETTHLGKLKKAREILRSIDPHIKCIAPFETALTPELPPGDLQPLFPDSVALEADGLPVGYRFPKTPNERAEFEKTRPHAYVYYPTLSNSYFAHMRRIIEHALRDAEMDGIYFDIFTYTGNFRWTYDRWDNRTVDMDLETFTIQRKKTELVKASEDARAELVKMILGFKPGNVVVANYMPVAAKIRALPIFHFKETLADYGYALSHFSTPIMLGWSPGYAPGAKSIGKEGSWWQEWKTDQDYFEDIKDKLRSGNLYYTYWAPPGRISESNLTRPTILARMFPITVEEIHAGWIRGRERIITLHSGKYSWKDNDPARAFFYDAKGCECDGVLRTRHQADGTLEFEIVVPSDGAAIIEKFTR